MTPQQDIAELRMQVSSARYHLRVADAFVQLQIGIAARTDDALDTSRVQLAVGRAHSAAERLARLEDELGERSAAR